jgi:uncharacterized protein YndB with AHSA1/START domain
MMSQPFSLEREILIHAGRETVFRFFTDSERFARWWGPGSRIEPRVAGAVKICYPGGVIASGEVAEIEPPRRIAFSYGYESGEPIGPGESLVTIELEDAAGGTRLRLTHACPSEAVRDAHDPGWRYQLAVFAKVAADDEFAEVAETVDRWYALWNEPSIQTRCEQALELLSADIEFRDAFGVTSNRDELMGHIEAARMHLRFERLERRGEVRRSHATALAEFAAVSEAGDARMSGTNVFELAPGGRIRRVVGIGN